MVTSCVKGFSHGRCSRLSKSEVSSGRARCDMDLTSEKDPLVATRSIAASAARLRPVGESKACCTRRNSTTAVEKVLGSMARPKIQSAT